MACETNDIQMQQKEYNEIVEMYTKTNQLDLLTQNEKSQKMMLHQRLVMDFLYKYKHRCEQQFPWKPYFIIWCCKMNCSVKNEELK